MARILIVDDEETLLYALVLQLRNAGHECRPCTTAAAALEALDSFDPEVALFDLNLPDMDGIELIDQARARGLDAPIVVLTAFGSVTSAVSAIKAGAEEYLQKPVAADDLEIVLRRCLDTTRLREHLDILKREQRRRVSAEVIIGESPALQDALGMLEKIAQIPPDAEGVRPTVLLTGETGTGKDLFARRLHELITGARGPGPEAPFVQVNCTAVPANLVEDELFGHERGAFTDAHSTKKGLFEFAHAGTIFLDEIGDLPPALQSKLLIVLERRVFRRLGSTTERRVRAQIVAATNRDLEELVARGDFRKDLYYRLHTFAIRLPALRARGADVALLTFHFLAQHARRLRAEPAELSEAAWRAVRAYSWPGNVRELSNVLQRALLLADRGVIEPAHLGLAPLPAESRSFAEERRPDGTDDALRFDFTHSDCTLDAVERKLIIAALNHTAGNISEVSRLLGVSRGALRHRMERLGIRLQTRRPE
ncbi:MAG TPA: sigma-54 dependent transcriptional regulator [Phycisphaerae bacterium]